MEETAGRSPLLTNPTETLCCFVPQDIDALCNQTPRIVDDSHACFEAQHCDVGMICVRIV